MELLAQLIIAVVLFAIVAYGLLWICRNFGLPAPVLWLCGALLLIVLLYGLASFMGHSGHLRMTP